MTDKNGIRESLCFIESIDGSGSNDDDASMRSNTNDEEIRRHDRRYRSLFNRDSSSSSSSSPVVEKITSIQYLEFDTSPNLNVIYSSDDYVSTSLGEGDVFEVTSSTVHNGGSSSGSGDTEVAEVGGSSLILYGQTSSGEMIRNRFFWLYEDCMGSLDGVEVGDGIGWVTVVSTFLYT